MLKQRKYLPLLILLAVLLAGCAEITVYNNGRFPAAVQVFTPDGSSGQTATIKAGESRTFYAFSGGNYRVNVIRNEEYRAYLQDLQSNAASVLLDTENPVADLPFDTGVNILIGAQDKLDQLATEKGGGCTGRIREIDIVDLIFGEGSAPQEQLFSVPLSFDESLNEWFALCLESN